jgi:hypothetical protein
VQQDRILPLSPHTRHVRRDNSVRTLEIVLDSQSDRRGTGKWEITPAAAPLGLERVVEALSWERARVHERSRRSSTVQAHSRQSSDLSRLFHDLRSATVQALSPRPMPGDSARLCSAGDRGLTQYFLERD